jgi:hypothetical protein
MNEDRWVRFTLPRMKFASQDCAGGHNGIWGDRRFGRKMAYAEARSGSRSCSFVTPSGRRSNSENTVLKLRPVSGPAARSLEGGCNEYPDIVSGIGHAIRLLVGLFVLN